MSDQRTSEYLEVGDQQEFWNAWNESTVRRSDQYQSDSQR